MSDKTKAILLSTASIALILCSLALLSIYCNARADNTIQSKSYQ